MLTVISPAKKLDETPAQGLPHTLPDFQAEARELAKAADALGAAKLGKLMKLSDSLARLNAGRFAAFEPESSLEKAKQAALIFNGDTYTGLDAQSLSAEDFTFAQTHLRILSGLYGLLRPLDLIQPYRLEMGSRLATKRGKSLYEYWGSKIAEALNAAAQEAGTGTLVNCASQEYFGAVDRNALKIAVIEPVFLEERDGSAKIVSFFAKKARGSMARFIIDQRVTRPEGLRDFTYGGYRLSQSESSDGRLVFLRDYPEPAQTKRAS
ncbi:peroxide stress protein YaaA [Pseudoruegeria sp. SHC-113]|uniref:peroxide stress protein YaaA n=1 Tax=Pseudoruegeria sp. SHC-113 TaxID=2855439 RepID=UPI0021BB2623|nr:peroxide stress protein YaaA [Pseudoruegeria sp. SHC-113]MCT8158803.1 peroxide stress protein YaaA [Pseudoruegeria sp. SHC-113]